MKILVVGGGNMGQTYAKSFLRSHITNKEHMMILEKSPEKVAELEKEQIGRIFDKPNGCLTEADLVIFAVKPQDALSVFKSIKHLIDPQQVFISIMAGVKIATIQEALGITKVIRAMPNLPAQIGEGMTVFTSTEEVTRIELVMVQNLLSTTGKSIYANDERAIDAATAISGSGPAYVFYFMNALMEAGQKMGFTEAESELLVSQTFKGAVELFQQTEHNCKDWIARVSSKGGTTEAAIKSWQKLDLEERLKEGARSAFNRAVELGKQ